MKRMLKRLVEFLKSNLIIQNDASGPNGGSAGGSETNVNLGGPAGGESSSTVNGAAVVQKETVIRANNAPQISSLLTNFNISLQANKNIGGAMGGRKTDDGNGKTENKRKKEVKLVCTALFLNNNEIRTLKALPETL